jgi:hypothetical protein
MSKQTAKTRYALRFVEGGGEAVNRPLYAILRRAKVRGMGTIRTYRLVEAGHERITTWVTREAAQRLADYHSRYPEHAKFEVVEYATPTTIHLTGLDAIFTPDQVALIAPEWLPRAQVAVALAPVRCVDCETYFPLGWVAMAGTPSCPSQPTGYGPHRADNTAIKSARDKVAKAYAQEG